MTDQIPELRADESHISHNVVEQFMAGSAGGAWRRPRMVTAGGATHITGAIGIG